RSRVRAPMIAATVPPTARTPAAIGYATAAPIPPPMQQTLAPAWMRVGCPSGPATSAIAAPRSSAFSLKVLLPTACTTSAIAPRAGSASAIVSGIRSPRSSMRTMTNWPGRRLRAMAGASTQKRTIEGARTSLSRMVYMSAGAALPENRQIAAVMTEHRKNRAGLRLVGGGTVNRRDRNAGEAQVDAELTAVMHEVIQDERAERRGARHREDLLAGAPQRPVRGELRVRPIEHRACRRHVRVERGEEMAAGCGRFRRRGRGREIELRMVQNGVAPIRELADVGGERGERHRLVVRLPGELFLRNALQQLPRRRGFVIEFGQEPVLDRHTP